MEAKPGFYKRSKDEFKAVKDPSTSSLLNLHQRRVIWANAAGIGFLVISSQTRVVNYISQLATMFGVWKQCQYTYVVVIALLVGNIVLTLCFAVMNMFRRAAQDQPITTGITPSKVARPRSLMVSKPSSPIVISSGTSPKSGSMHASPVLLSQGNVSSPGEGAGSLSVQWTPSRTQGIVGNKHGGMSSSLSFGGTPLRTPANLSSSHIASSSVNSLRSPSHTNRVEERGSEIISSEGTPGRNKPSCSKTGSSPLALFRQQSPKSQSILPDTGSPLINEEAAQQLPRWTEKLFENLVGTSFTKGTSTSISPSPLRGKNEEKDTLTKAKMIERTIVPPEKTFLQLGIEQDLEFLTENLLKWFSLKVIKPLAKDIEAVAYAFEQAGLEHLGPSFPASYSLFSKAKSELKNDTISIIPSATTTDAASPFPPAKLIFNGPRPQSLLELAHTNKSDPIVQRRLRLEKYLNFANMASHRSHTIRRIKELAEGPMPWLGKRLLDESVHGRVEDDGELFMHLFCTFLDENLPSEEYYSQQPFSQRHFVSLEDNEAASTKGRPDTIQIVQTGRSPAQFELIAEDRVYKVYSGTYNVIHVIICFIEFVHCRRGGFLGIGNLGSSNIDLLSVLNVTLRQRFSVL